MEKVIASATLPFLEFGKKTSNFVITNFYTYIANVNGQKKYYEIVKEVNRLKAKMMMCQALEQENKRLKSLLLMKYSYNFKFIGTNVIDNMAFSGVNIITIDKGENSGVKDNSAVVDGNGIVGRVWKLFPNQSQVQLISDNSSGVGVIIPDRGVGGILNGTGSLVHGEIKYIPDSANIQVGDLVFTSGTDGIYPPNLFVGEVISVEKDKSFFLKIKLEYAAKLSSLQHLVVIVKKDGVNE